MASMTARLRCMRARASGASVATAPSRATDSTASSVRPWPVRAIASGMPAGYAAKPGILGSMSVPARVEELMAMATGDEKHDVSAHSTLDILWVLYDRVLRFDAA